MQRYVLAGSVAYVALVGMELLLATHGIFRPHAYHIVPPEPVQLIVEPDAGMEPLADAIRTASSSIDMVMYELDDTEIESALAAAAGRCVTVNVILGNGYYGARSKANAAAYAYLKSHGVSVQWSSSVFALTHQKTLILDGNKALILTFNLDSTYYARDRDFGVSDPDPHDVQAIARVFDADWQAAQRPASAIPAASNGDDLVWSPGSKELLLEMIGAARKSLDVSNEELADPNIEHALAAAAGRGVTVRLLMTDSSEWHDGFAALTAAGAQVHVFSSTAGERLYIHAKVIIADSQQAFIGSQNFSKTSLEQNRELGLLVSTPKIVQKLESVFGSDWNSADPYTN